MIVCIKKGCVWRVDCGYGKAVCHKQYCPYMRQAGALPPKPPENSSKWDAAVEILRNYAKEHGYDKQREKAAPAAVHTAAARNGQALR